MSKSRGTSAPVKRGIERWKDSKRGKRRAGAPPVCLLVTSERLLLMQRCYGNKRLMMYWSQNFKKQKKRLEPPQKFNLYTFFI